MSEGKQNHARFLAAPPARSLGPSSLERPWLRRFRAHVWSRFPRALRQAILARVLGNRRAPLAVDAPAAEPLSIVGLQGTSTGMGEGARLAASALAALGYQVLNVDVSPLLSGTPPPRSRPPALEEGPGTAILHFNPDHLSAILTLLGRRRLRGKRIVGYWAWELARIPDRWLAAFVEVDEVWTPTQFVADAVRPFTHKPVRVVPHPVALAKPGRRAPERFGFEGRFTVLTIFTFSSSFPRKNPVAAVKAFERAFGRSPEHLLVLKVSDAAGAPEDMAELTAAIGDAPNIRFEERLLSDSERLDLIASADCLLSLHRSEGFGLTMAEAMLAGVPVVATDWSGNLDFMDDRTALLVSSRMIEAADRKGVYGTGELWADPDVEVAASHLRRLAERPSDFAPMVEAARAMAADRLGLAAYGQAVAEAIGSPGRAPA